MSKRVTRAQAKRTPVRAICQFHDFTWPKRGTVEVLDTNGRVMFSSTGPMSVRNMSDLVIKSGHRKIHVNEWRERGMYDVTVDHGKKMGRFPEVYVFLVVNGTMLYNRSDYDDIERGHAAMRAGVVAITQGIVSDTCPGAPCTTAHADTTGNTSVAVTAPNATLDESAHAVITAGGATGTM
jgi:hypothetical protein